MLSFSLRTARERGIPVRRFGLRALVLACLTISTLAAQDQPSAAPPAGSPAKADAEAILAAKQPETEPPGGKRVMGVLPNHRTADASQEGTVLPSREKLSIAVKDSFDYPLVMMAGVLAALGQWSNQQPSFGQGMKGYAHRLVTTYADQAMGNLFTEGLFPVILREDPRYFRRATGSTGSRIRYAVTRVIVTHKDSGGNRFNFSEWLGNASAVAISNTYYPDARSFSKSGTKLLLQVGTDAFSQVLKEFWPDVQRKLHHKKAGS